MITNRDEAMQIVFSLPELTRDAIAVLCETEEVQGDYEFNGEDSVWMNDAQRTLDHLAAMIRRGTKERP